MTILPLVTPEQVEALDPRLRIPPDEEPRFYVLVEESIDLVQGYLGSDLRKLDEIPGPIQRVVQRMVIRSLLQLDSTDGVPTNAINATDAAGPFSRSYGFESGTTSGGVWLTNQDKVALRPWTRGKAFTIGMY